MPWIQIVWTIFLPHWVNINMQDLQELFFNRILVETPRLLGWGIHIVLCLLRLRRSPEMWPVLIVLELVSIVAANDFAFVAPSWQNLELSAGQTRITPVVPEVNNGFPKQAMWVKGYLIPSSTMTAYDCFLGASLNTRTDKCPEHSHGKWHVGKWFLHSCKTMSIDAEKTLYRKYVINSVEKKIGQKYPVFQKRGNLQNPHKVSNGRSTKDPHTHQRHYMFGTAKPRWRDGNGHKLKVAKSKNHQSDIYFSFIYLCTWCTHAHIHTLLTY